MPSFALTQIIFDHALCLLSANAVDNAQSASSDIIIAGSPVCAACSLSEAWVLLSAEVVSDGVSEVLSLAFVSEALSDCVSDVSAAVSDTISDAVTVIRHIPQA